MTNTGGGHVACCGLTTIDLVFRVSDPPRANTKVTADGWRMDVGGPAANAARTIAVLGGSAHLVTALGESPFATLARSALETEGITLTDVAPPDHQIPISSVTIDRDGGRAVVSANARELEGVSPATLPETDALLVDGHLMVTGLQLARQAREREVPVVFDGGSYKPHTEELLEFVDIAAVSADFSLPRIGGGPNMMQAIRDLGVSAVIRTDGERPVRLLTADGSFSIPAPPVRAVDTLGAGDVFHGVLALAVARGLSIQDGVAQAVEIASRSVEHEGVLGWVSA